MLSFEEEVKEEVFQIDTTSVKGSGTQILNNADMFESQLRGPPQI